MAAKKLDPPDHLSERSQALWRDIVPGRARSAGRLALLTTALEALDAADAAARELEEVGQTFTTKTTGTVHVHPLVRIERDKRKLFRQCWSDLKLGWDPAVDGRG